MRKADIVKLMHMLSKEERVKAYEAPVARARMTFLFPKVTVSSLQEFIDTCAIFCAHCARELTRTADPTPQWSRNAAVTILTERYPGGMLAAYRIAEEGINGGIRAVFDAISDAIREQRAEEYFQHAIHECVDTMDPDDVLELTSQFLDRYHEDAIGWPNFPPSPAALVPEYKQIIRVLADAISDVESAMGMMPSCEPAAAATRRQTGPLAGDAR